LTAAAGEAVQEQLATSGEGAAMVRKAFRMLVSVGVTLLVASQWADIKRYLKIKQLSVRQGHPENVPAHGRTAYPLAPGRGATDGTGDFDSASRGGPARVG
jgi:hypothetical protein